MKSKFATPLFFLLNPGFVNLGFLLIRRFVNQPFPLPLAKFWQAALAPDRRARTHDFTSQLATSRVVQLSLMDHVIQQHEVVVLPGHMVNVPGRILALLKIIRPLFINLIDSLFIDNS